MKKILLACSSGMSTSLLVTKMEKHAEAGGEEAKIWVTGQDKAKQEMADVDVVLIGPQMIFMKKDLQNEPGECSRHSKYRIIKINWFTSADQRYYSLSCCFSQSSCAGASID